MASGEVRFIFNQIDYIIVQQDHAHSLISARSFGGAETSSDHKIVKMIIEINWVKLYRRKQEPKPKKLNITFIN